MDQSGFSLFAAATIEIEGFVYIQGDITLTKTDKVAAREVGSTTAFEASVLSVGVANAVVFAGIGTPAIDETTDGDGNVTSRRVDADSDATGVALSLDSMGLHIVKEMAADPATADPTQLRSWMVVKATGAVRHR